MPPVVGIGARVNTVERCHDKIVRPRPDLLDWTKVLA
jgi:hypothetical protein